MLKKSRWCLLKKPENLTDHQRVKLRDVLRYNLKSVRAYLYKEDFQRFWEYESPVWAGKFLDQWCKDVMRSIIDPLKKFVFWLLGGMASSFASRIMASSSISPDEVESP